MDRLKADFIASLPYAAKRPRQLFILNASRWIEAENVITSAGGEKRAPRDPVRPETN
jgi:hypothetical protein